MHGTTALSDAARGTWHCTRHVVLGQPGDHLYGLNLHKSARLTPYLTCGPVAILDLAVLHTGAVCSADGRGACRMRPCGWRNLAARGKLLAGKRRGTCRRSRSRAQVHVLRSDFLART